MNLGAAESVTGLQGGDCLMAEVGGSIRRVSFANVKTDLMGALVTPPTEFTLEQSSDPAFTVNNEWAARVYLSAMGGYMLKVSGGKVYAAKLNPSNWNYFEDGTAVDDASKYETMVRVPPATSRRATRPCSSEVSRPFREATRSARPDGWGLTRCTLTLRAQATAAPMLARRTQGL